MMYKPEDIGYILEKVFRNINGLLVDRSNLVQHGSFQFSVLPTHFFNLRTLRNAHFPDSYLLQKAKNGIVLQVRNIQLQFRFLFSLVFHPVENLSKF